MTECILYEWIVKAFKLKKCLNCRFYACGQCCYVRTFCPRKKFQSCWRFSLRGYYDRYKEFLTKVIKYHEQHLPVDTKKYIQSLRKKHLINAFELFLYPTYVRLWFMQEGECHFCHFAKDWYELDANVILNINKKKKGDINGTRRIKRMHNLRRRV